MTDFKGIQKKYKSRSLYFGMLRYIIVGTILAVLSYIAVMIPAVIVIGEVYESPEEKAIRREEYLTELQDYVTDNKVDSLSMEKFSEWIRENRYVYLAVYTDLAPVPTVKVQSAPTPSPELRVIDFVGSGIDDSLSNDELIKAAKKHGYFYLDLADTRITVAIDEYTENLQYTTWSSVAFITFAVVFTLSIINYVRIIIERIKRFESDVTIVSEMDMNYEIVVEGADEIANLSTNVERMRRRMLDHIKSEQEARQANTELITSISHDIRTPLTVLMGYIEMMKERQAETGDELMESYIAATESTAQRLKQLSDDMFKYSLAFGDTKGSINLEEYDALTLFDQLLSEHILLMREMGYDIHTLYTGDKLDDGCVVLTDAQNLMRIVDNIFSNLRKYADIEHPILFTINARHGRITFECENKIKKDTDEAESNGIGLKTCKRLASIIANRFEYQSDGDYFTCRLILDYRKSVIMGEIADNDIIGE